MFEPARYPNLKQVILFTTTAPLGGAAAATASVTERSNQVVGVPTEQLTAFEKIMLALAEYEYLTALQVTRLLYAQSSLAYVRKKLKTMVDTSFILPLGGRAVNLPLIYTLSSKGRQYAEVLGKPPSRRFRPSEEWEKAENLFFMKHTLAVSDVLIGARLLSQTVPGIVLTRMFTERALKRKIYVAIPEPAKRGRGKTQTICIEPDASVDFEIYEAWHEQTWQDFMHIEVYRHLPMETRFKQKVKGYMVYATTGQHEALFHTSALSIAVFAATDQQAATLKRWTEEVLHDQPQFGEYFLFRSIDTATASPTEMYLAPVWQKAFGEVPIPLLMLKEEDNGG
jgi:hypothetical protein